MAKPISIDVVSDVVCPWCFVGMKHLQKALSKLPDIEATVSWRPYQLDATIPTEGLDRQAYMLAKFGDPARLAAAHERLLELGKEDGIAFDFNAIKVAPNTLDAHRLIRWAEGGSQQSALVAELFSRYFERGQNIGDRVVLREAAEAVGMDGALAESMLASDADAAEVKAEIETAGRMGVTGVPCFILARKYAVMGAQPVDVLADAISQAAAEEAASA